MWARWGSSVPLQTLRQIYADFHHRAHVPALANQGLYLGSEAAFYRVMKAANQVTPQGRARPPTLRRTDPLTATAPHQVWSWDITYLATIVKGLFFYLYLFLDVFSRKIVGWGVFSRESAEQAATVDSRAYLRERVTPQNLVLHADRVGDISMTFALLCPDVLISTAICLLVR